MWNLAHHLNHVEQIEVYGGFVRDFILAGCPHNQADIDVHTMRGVSHRSIQNKINKWAADNACILVKSTPKGRNVTEHEVMAPDQWSFSVQSVNSRGFGAYNPDFDVNTLCVRAGVVHMMDNDSDLDMEQILRNISNHTAVQLKPDTEPRMIQRREKLESRGWVVRVVPSA